jgi:hypothetical protein
MTKAIAAFIAIGLSVALAIGLARGFDTVAIVIFAFLVGVGVLSVAASARFRAGGIAPGKCAECGGLISPNAPYCKHCGAPTG